MKKILLVLLLSCIILAGCTSVDTKKEDCHHDVKMWDGATISDTVFFNYEDGNCYIGVFERGYSFEENRWVLFINRNEVIDFKDNYDFGENAIDKYNLVEYQRLGDKDNFK